MKTMTCRELGGACDQELSANSWDEMVQTITKHVIAKHPDVAKQMEKMHNEDLSKCVFPVARKLAGDGFAHLAASRSQQSPHASLSAKHSAAQLLRLRCC